MGLDGFDPDVLANLVVFYRACGFDVSIAATPRDCDLLVIQRGAYRGQVFPTRAARCHIYDYAAMGTSDLHLAFPEVIENVVISPGPRVSGHGSPPTHVVRSFHPVIPVLWRANGGTAAARTHQFVHIGHRKAKPADDAWFLQLDAVARETDCGFWGAGWDAVGRPDSPNMHGPVSLHGSQHIYRRSRFALGVMYPHQRGLTLSGRMWQAPLNGCALFSEAMIPGLVLPGVAVCDDYRRIMRDPPPGPGFAALLDEASEFWSAATCRLAPLLGLDYRPAGRWRANQSYFRWVYLRHVKNFTGSRLRRRA